MSVSNENKKSRDKELSRATAKDVSDVETTTSTIAENLETGSSASFESSRQSRNARRDQRDAYNAILDESERNIERATQEAKNQIPKFTETVNAFQHETLQSARDIANNQINTQREIVSSLQNSWFPYWERTYSLFWEYMSPQRFVEMYTNFVGSFADSTITATRLSNNNMLSFLESAKQMMGQAKRTSDDLSRATSNIAKKMEKDPQITREREVHYNVESTS